MATAALLCALLLAPNVAAAQQSSAADAEAVIPPGREEFLAEMLGQNTALPNQCTFVGGQVEHTFIRGRYACRAGDVILELHYPSSAPATATRTARFAIVVVQGSPPANFMQALESRIRSREVAFEWTWQSQPHPHQPAPGRVVVVAGLLALVAPALGVWRLLRRRRPARITPPSSTGIAIGAMAVVTGLLCVAVHVTLRAGGEVFAALIRGDSPAELLVDEVRVGVLLAASLFAATLVGRFVRRPWLWAWAGVIATIYLLVGWRLSLLPDDLHYFGSLSTHAPNTSWTEVHPVRPQVTYRISSTGFREPDFEERKPAGVIRVALIGDSYVFGIGVENDGSLPARLQAELARRWPTQRFEVLNLGVPGNNLASHVELFDVASARFHPDAVVLCLTLPNDLSRWDEQAGRRDARRPSLFSLVRFLIGDAANSLWASMLLDSVVTPTGLAHLDAQISRLETLRRQSAQTAVLVLFGFSPWDKGIAARLQQMPGMTLVPNRTTLPEEFIAGDGHPTAIGNNRSAAVIAETLAEDPLWRGLLQPTPGP